MKDDMILYQYDTKKVEKEKKNFHEKFTFFGEEITQNTQGWLKSYRGEYTKNFWKILWL